jgi:uncharacterized protein (TIGR02646 family)
MRKIEKDLEAIPASLRLPDAKDFANGHERRRADATHSCRKALLELRAYPTKEAGKFNDRYKLGDTRLALDYLYQKFCAYCEEYVGAGHVEHYRPKSIYWWLAYSWDNLLCVCPACNSTKGNRFEIDGDRCSEPEEDYNWADIHRLGASYDAIERPRIVNPEVEDPKDAIHYSQLGEIYSDDARYRHTMEVCGLHREALRVRRKKVVDDLRNQFAIAYKYNESDHLKAVLSHTWKTIKMNTRPEDGFSNFRNYVVRNWLSDLLLQAQSGEDKD